MSLHDQPDARLHPWPGPRLGRAGRQLLLAAAAVTVVSTAACGSTSAPAARSPSPGPTASSSGVDPATSSLPPVLAGLATPGGPVTPGRARDASAPAVPAPTGATRTTTPRHLWPVRISIPAIDVDAAVTDLGIAGNGSIEVPEDPAEAGWLDTTPVPGRRGPAVVAGHVDSTTGPAVFYRLATLSVGDVVHLTRRDGSAVTFTVDGVRRYPQSAFPTREVYGPVPAPALRLITCGGDYVKADGGYQDNVVVYAS